MGVDIRQYILLGVELDKEKFKSTEEKNEKLFAFCGRNGKFSNLEVIEDCYNEEYIYLGHVIATADYEDGEWLENHSFNKIWADEELKEKVLSDIRLLHVELGEEFDLPLDLFYITHYS